MKKIMYYALDHGWLEVTEEQKEKLIEVFKEKRLPKPEFIYEEINQTK